MEKFDILVGFSGGVDSCVASLLLRRQGFRVAGAIMSVRGSAATVAQGCGIKEDIPAAQLLAEQVGIPLFVIDCASAYRREVLDYFRREYLAGRTPNPCVQCNPEVKFGLLPRLARDSGLSFDRFATGHYARIEYSPEHGRHLLLRGADRQKDQSYFLYRLSREQLASTLFPLGGFHKGEVRRIAAELGVPVHDKPDSQDFYTGDYAEMLGEPEREGEIVDADGKLLGRHQGYWNFTPGQRKGLGVAFSEPLYVIRVEPAANRVVVGTRQEHLRNGCVIENAVFHLPDPVPGAVLPGRMRSSQPLHEMTLGERLENGCRAVRFAKPQHGVAPGQSLVLYDGEIVAGGGVIRESL